MPEETPTPPKVDAIRLPIHHRPVRHKLPDERKSVTHKFSIGGHEGYITVGMYDDGAPGEIFISMAKEGSMIAGLMDAFATAISYNLQYGVPLKFLVDRFSNVRFEPSGWTGNQNVPYAKSIIDYVFRWLGVKFLDAEYGKTEVSETVAFRPAESGPQDSARICAECGSMMTHMAGNCWKCHNCGNTSGC